MKKKRGMEMAVSTIILIVLGVLVLVGLLFLLTTQTTFFSNFLATIFSKTNVDQVVGSCNSLASTNSVYSYCCEEKEVKLGGAQENLELTCDELRDEDFIGGRILSLDCSGTSCT